MFNRSYMDHCMIDVTSEGFNESRNFKNEDSLSRNMFSRSNMDNSLADLTSVYNVYNVQYLRLFGHEYVQQVKYGILSG
jgi:ribulose bisphosphate carboxylase small subunit